MTASAKLNSSTRRFTAPSSRPVEIVAPERENPRNGKDKPWMAPIQAASRIPTSRLPARRRSVNPAIKINTPTAASEAAINGRLSKRSLDLGLAGYLRQRVPQRLAMTTNVNVVAITSRTACCLNTSREAKMLFFQARQK